MKGKIKDKVFASRVIEAVFTVMNKVRLHPQ